MASVWRWDTDYVGSTSTILPHLVEKSGNLVNEHDLKNFV